MQAFNQNIFTKGYETARKSSVYYYLPVFDTLILRYKGPRAL